MKAVFWLFCILAVFTLLLVNKANSLKCISSSCGTLMGVTACPSPAREIECQQSQLGMAGQPDRCMTMNVTMSQFGMKVNAIAKTCGNTALCANPQLVCAQFNSTDCEMKCCDTDLCNKGAVIPTQPVEPTRPTGGDVSCDECSNMPGTPAISCKNPIRRTCGSNILGREDRCITMKGSGKVNGILKHFEMRNCSNRVMCAMDICNIMNRTSPGQGQMASCDVKCCIGNNCNAPPSSATTPVAGGFTTTGPVIVSGKPERRCPQICPAIYRPVCGSNNKTYSNPCKLRVASCESGGKIRLSKPGKCGSGKPDRRCPRICPQSYRPVCGSDNKTYSNPCELRIASCESGGKIRLSKLGKCGSGKPERRCPRICPEIYRPMCGSDNKTYSNPCELRIASCKSSGKIRLSKPGKCGSGKPDRRCPRICPQIYRPVCGSDNKTYSNPCELRVASCESGGNIRLSKPGKCGSGKPDRRCLRPCTKIYRPVCGSDGKTHGNECVLRIASCKSGGKIRMVHRGKCGSGKPDRRCLRPCTKIYRPVCGSDGKTHANECVLRIASCKSGGKIRMVNRGKCGPCSNHTCTNPVNSKCRVSKGKPVCSCLFGCARIHRPVCGSDGKTYPNTCGLQQASCRKNTTISVVNRGSCGGSQRLCARLKCRAPMTCKVIFGRPRCVAGSCYRKCPHSRRHHSAPVCASDGRTYRSECHMKNHACLTRKTLTVRSRGRCKAQPRRCGFLCRGPFKECKTINGRSTCVQKRRTSCPRACPRRYKPLCGTDGETYSNVCVFNQKACKTTGLRIALWGPCQGGVSSRLCGFRCRGIPYSVCKIRRFRRICECPNPHSIGCKRIVNRVCGSDGKTYQNPCMLKYQACKTRRMITIAKRGECSGAGGDVRPPYSTCKFVNDKRRCECPRMCPNLYKPVCGSDSKTYSNFCQLRVRSCELRNMISVAKQGRCGSGGGNMRQPYSICKFVNDKRRCECPRMCQNLYKPVCGSDSKTYSNFCQLKVRSCELGRMIRVAKQGRCGSGGGNMHPPYSICKFVNDKRRCVCPKKCPKSYRPVCGSDGETYSNFCQLRMRACETRKIIRVAKQGRCGSGCFKKYPAGCYANDTLPVTIGCTAGRKWFTVGTAELVQTDGSLIDSGETSSELLRQCNASRKETADGQGATCVISQAGTHRAGTKVKITFYCWTK